MIALLALVLLGVAWALLDLWAYHHGRGKYRR